MYLLVGTKGGVNRFQIIKAISEAPMNANQIGEKLDLDYKTVQHHVRVLEENKIILAGSPKGTYGLLYFLSPYMESNIAVIEEMWVKFGKK